ncbi:Glycine/sarcosine/betaine reductase complex component C subunit alpha [Caloramator mitchellensis]|uniref:Glycine/sarcosine/betaine reductase complex component C subunit alpha n=1 Tax=Caloramator mitchellensis TaxID=908809 RepID=A0A0R3K0G3_CALMK|nr:glycine/sarcosine/betaine reductase complex component C subunit alpha [Caloramator mitchellensis]KRQ88029.1 Glycine/sarcosine/betaine reductase complex component C subunit alpha [Caloramator mitchellensis]
MTNENIKGLIGEVFNEIADAIKSGTFGKKVRVGLTTFGSEHGVEELVKAAEIATRKYSDFEVVLIGPKVETNLKVYEVANDEEGHKLMEELLDKGEINGCVTQHYNFPIGVSTVGRVITPGRGNELILATTTGTSSTHRVEGMIKNAIYGIITAKACGIANPTVGILNVDGARQVEKALKELKSNGYDINFAESIRADGGVVMRGNDLLAGSTDVMVMDTLTGNLLVKIFSSFTTGGDYESLGYGYGPGIGEGYDRLICIISRASGAPVVAEALRFCATCAQNNIIQISKNEFEKANRAGLKEILSKLIKQAQPEDKKEIVAPPKKVVTHDIAGVDILELENAVKELWSNGIYSETGMGCTGPIVLVADEDADKAVEILKSKGYIA